MLNSEILNKTKIKTQTELFEGPKIHLFSCPVIIIAFDLLSIGRVSFVTLPCIGGAMTIAMAVKFTIFLTQDLKLSPPFLSLHHLIHTIHIEKCLPLELPVDKI